MIISTKIRYGLRTLLEIAKAKPEEGILQKDISINQEISNKYLDHIIRDMKVAELICNRKNKKSGYRLCKSPSEINVYMVYRAFEPELCLIECLDEKNGFCSRVAECSTQPVWKELNRKMRDYMTSVTLQDIIEGKVLNI